MMLKISVSGVRGIVGEGLTVDVASQFGFAFGKFTKGAKVLIGRDTRTSGKLMRDAVACGLLCAGTKTADLGICPTPTVLLMARRLKCYGIIITASHNPPEWNGIKFVKRDGTFLTKSDMKTLYDIYRSGNFLCETECGKADKIQKIKNAKDIHINTVINNISKNLIKRKKFKVACDFCNGTGAVITKRFLHKLGCRVYAINDKPDGLFAHDPEPTSKNLKSLSRFVRKTGADIGIAQDPDADRLVLCDEKARLIGEENTIALAVKAILSGKRGRVVVNISTSNAIDDVASEFGIKVERAPVGEVNVVEKMKEIKALIGGEGNGGVIYPKINFCRDSLVGIGIILEYMASRDKSLSRLLAEIPQYKMVKGKFHIPQGKTETVINRLRKKFKDEKRISGDGLKIIWPKKGWVHVRSSNTEPIMRVIAEADTLKRAKTLFNMVKREVV